MAMAASVSLSASAPLRSVQPARAAKSSRIRRQQVVASRRTSTQPARFRLALKRAYQQVTGKTATKETLDILTAHVSHETARGDRMYNYNFGGIKGVSPSGMTARYKTHEYIDGAKTKMVDGFRAYRNLDEGAVDYVALLATRYSSALHQAERGDIDGFSAALKQRHYYTAPVDGYSRALRGLLRQGTAPLDPASAHEMAHNIAVQPQHIDTLPTIDLVRAIHEVTALAANIAAPADEESVDG